MARAGSNKPDFETWPSKARTQFREALARWYARRARDLPWRRTGDPYQIWISEVMLQQTTVVAVVPYFERFINHFPTVQALAAARQEDVLRLWEGLGYYSRARNLHRAAQELVRNSNGIFPQTVEELTELPGIGRYTAGAILSFAFDLPAPILEANTLRLYSRLMAYEGDPRAVAGQKALWAFASHLLPEAGSGQLNQALMELGALVCTPSEPDCDQCPVHKHCLAQRQQRQHLIPPPAIRPEVTEVLEASVAVMHDGRVLLRRNPEGQRWAGLWDFVRFSLDDISAADAAALKPSRKLPVSIVRTIEERVFEVSNQRARVEQLLTQMRHSVTRYRIQLPCFLATAMKPFVTASSEFRWVHPTEINELPLSVTGRKFAVLLERHLQAENETPAAPGQLF